MFFFVFLSLFSPCMRACGLRGAYSGTIHYIGTIHHTTHHLQEYWVLGQHSGYQFGPLCAPCPGTVALRANLLYRSPFLRSTVPLFICLFVCLFLLYQKGQPPSDLLYLRFGPNLLYQTFVVKGGGGPPHFDLVQRDSGQRCPAPTVSRPDVYCTALSRVTVLGK